MIKNYSLKALEKAINHGLSLDESTADKMTALEGKVIEIIVAPLDVNFFIAFEQQQLKLLAQFSGQPDTVIHSNPLGLIRLSFLPASKARSLFNDKIRLSGDIETGLAVKKIFDELDIDWEGHLAHFTGDVVAFQVGSIVKQGLAFQRQLTHSMRYNLTDYLQEELRLFPTREEVNDFFNDIDSLSMDVERISAQIKLIMASHEIN